MVAAAGITSLNLHTAASVVSFGKATSLGSARGFNGVRLNIAAVVLRATPSARPGLSLRANVFDDAKKAASRGQAEAGKAKADAEKELKSDYSQVKSKVGKVEADLEGKAADVKSEVEAESAETKDKVGTAVEELKEREHDAIESETN